MKPELVIIVVGSLVLVSHVFRAASARTGIPDILWLFAVGLLVGPVLGLLSPADFGALGRVFTTVTLILLLFESGLDLHITSLGPLLRESVFITVFNFLGSMAVVTGIALALTDLDVINAVIVGSILGGTSSAVVTTLVRQSGMSREVGNILVIESAISDMFTLGVPLALINTMTGKHFDTGSFGGTMITSFALAIAGGTAGAFVWAALHRHFPTVKDVLFSTPAFVFILYGAVELLNISGPIAVLVFAIVFGNMDIIRPPADGDPSEPPLSTAERMFLGETVFLLRIFFFVYIGISSRLDDIMMLGVGLVFFFGLLLVRIPIVQLSLARHRSIADASLAAVIIPKGLGAAVLASIPLQMGLPAGATIQKLTFAVIIFSTIFSVLLAFLVPSTALGALYARLFRRRPPV